MSYIQKNILGKDRGLKFNQYAMIILSQKVDPENYQQTANYAMIYAGLAANCYVKGIEKDFTFEQVCDFVDTMSQEDINDIDACLGETQVYKNAIAAGDKTAKPSKKKSKNTTVKV